MQILVRTTDKKVEAKALLLGAHPLQARILAKRLSSSQNLELDKIIKPKLKYIAAPSQLKDIDKGTQRLVEAIKAGETIGILTDYDADGITSHMVLFDALHSFFGVEKSKLISLIGHRIKDGYGISASLVTKILQKNEQLEKPISLIITADCGSTDEEQISILKANGIETIITDHHSLLKTPVPKSALATINPNQQNCPYPDKTIAGCMVAWLFMASVRKALIDAQILPENTPHLASLLAYVALGTVADCVSLGTSFINRSLINVGLDYINTSENPAWRLLKQMLKQKKFSAETLAFQVAPRINARSRIADPYAALFFLQAKDIDEAEAYFKILDEDNKERKEIEAQMLEAAFHYANLQLEQNFQALTIFLPSGHSGVAGIVASRLVERFGLPTLVLTQDANNVENLLASGRSVEDINILQILTEIAENFNIFVKFGGHKGAAGATIYKKRLALLQKEFSFSVKKHLEGRELSPKIYTDAGLDIDEINIATLELFEGLEPFGREFEAPLFTDNFEVLDINMVGRPQIHMQLVLGREGRKFNSIWFRAKDNPEQPEPVKIGKSYKFAYSLNANIWQNTKRLQLIIRSAVGSLRSQNSGIR